MDNEKRKDQLLSDIMQLVTQFTADTNLYVTRVDIDVIDTTQYGERPNAVYGRVVIKVKFPE